RIRWARLIDNDRGILEAVDAAGGREDVSRHPDRLCEGSQARPGPVVDLPGPVRHEFAAGIVRERREVDDAVDALEVLGAEPPSVLADELQALVRLEPMVAEEEAVDGVHLVALLHEHGYEGGADIAGCAGHEDPGHGCLL